jgi:hypothetical protein
MNLGGHRPFPDLLKSHRAKNFFVRVFAEIPLGGISCHHNGGILLSIRLVCKDSSVSFHLLKISRVAPAVHSV